MIECHVSFEWCMSSGSHSWGYYPSALWIGQICATQLRADTCRWNLLVPDLQTSCNDLTEMIDYQYNNPIANLIHPIDITSASMINDSVLFSLNNSQVPNIASKTRFQSLHIGFFCPNFLFESHFQEIFCIPWEFTGLVINVSRKHRCKQCVFYDCYVKLILKYTKNVCCESKVCLKICSKSIVTSNWYNSKHKRVLQNDI